jgi:hypothetical protein
MITAGKVDMITANRIDPQCITYSQMNLIFNARTLYRRLATWTRAYMISRYLGMGTSDELFGRLYYESLDIGNKLSIIIGRENAEKYSQLLSQFVIALRDLISAQIAGDTAGMETNLSLLYQNAEERENFLISINPYWRWTETEMENPLATYLRYTLEEANTLASHDYTKDIEVFDRLLTSADRLGDVLADGLYDYLTSGIPNPYPLPPGIHCITYEEMNDIYRVRMVWYDLVTWVRYYMLSRYLGIGNPEETLARLRQVATEFVEAMKHIFGDRVPEDYLQLFQTYISLIEELITAQIEDNIDEMNRVTQLLYQNADERAAAIASILPDYWDEEDWRTRLYGNLRSTIDESTTFLTQDYTRNIDIFSRLLDQSENTGNYLTQGLFQYLEQRT